MGRRTVKSAQPSLFDDASAGPAGPKKKPRANHQAATRQKPTPKRQTIVPKKPARATARAARNRTATQLGVPTIAEQVQRSLQAEADAKVEHAAAAGKKRSRTTIPLPIVRPGPFGLCYRDRGYLERVRDFSFDPTDPLFAKYVLARVGVAPVARDQYGKAVLQDCWELFLKDRAGFKRFVATARKPDDIFVYCRKQAFVSGDKRIAGYEVAAPRLAPSGELFVNLGDALTAARHLAKAAGSSVWYQRTHTEAASLVVTCRGIKNGYPPVADRTTRTAKR